LSRSLKNLASTGESAMKRLRESVSVRTLWRDETYNTTIEKTTVRRPQARKMI
jgi:hypothetical protein